MSEPLSESSSRASLFEDDHEMDERDLEWVRGLLAMFPPDALTRLARAEHDYYSTHGEYVPGLARLLLYYREKLARAAYIAEHLAQMIDRETWRSTGGDDGQGHYEGDYRAEQIHAEIQALKRSVGG